MGTAIGLFGQPDTAFVLVPEVLSDTNVQVRRTDALERLAISATRSLDRVEDLPHTVWVFTAQEIARHGFVTLADVLRAVPGVRVSQPGNALEGELFLVRGLRGNAYTKVLINDVPIRPSAAPGMPIGAQLPLSQCERIEVLIGPASAVYGDGACAAVINLILRESERPVYTQADLSLGNYGFNRLDLTLGGKLFQGKNSFRFSLYGSSTVREATDYYYDNRLFVPAHYLPFGLDTSLLRLLPNYRPQTPGDSVARTAAIPHESRLLGLHFTWRGIRFQYHRMSRFEHSSLGLSPLAASYANPSNRVAEQIEVFAAGLQRTRRRTTTSHLLSFMRYSVQGSSAFAPVFDGLSAALYAAQTPTTDDERRQLIRALAQRYADEERYQTANGIDLRLESRRHTALTPRLSLDAGLQVNVAGGVPPMGYFRTPVTTSVGGSTDPPVDLPIPVGNQTTADANLFAQGTWRTQRSFLLGGVALQAASGGLPVLAPRLALRHAFDSSLSARLTYAEGFQRPLAFRAAHTYWLGRGGPTDARPLIADEALIGLPERTRAAEMGLRLQKYASVEVIAFYQEARQLTRDGHMTLTDAGWRYGFRQTPDLALRLWGIQAVLGRQLFHSRMHREDLGKNEVGLHVEYAFQYSRGQEWFGDDRPALSDVRNFPRRLTQLRLLAFGRRWEANIFYLRGATMSSSVVAYSARYQRSQTPAALPNFATFDLTFRLFLSNYFSAYVEARNLFNRRYAGIDATQTPDDLLYNPQPRRLMRVGVSYKLD
ncbi:MAG: TonB-dependent receptor [Saprospiraceae bacterium]|nr:TonB-dependent receptor [Saprospiraceae bacterium]